MLLLDVAAAEAPLPDDMPRALHCCALMLFDADAAIMMLLPPRNILITPVDAAPLLSC